MRSQLVNLSEHMPIDQNNISILIPTYRYRDKVVRAVESALASDAGEIIVVDDCGQDGTMERLGLFSDTRLRVHENKCNLGLWENHLQALGMATRPWIKFVQADDYLLPNGLRAYAEAATEGVSVIFCAPTVRDDVTAELSYFHKLDRPRRVTPRQLQEACLLGGWILGSPSHMLLRSAAIERDPAAWRTHVSSDLIIGSIAASRGDTMLMPVGAIGQGAHPQQDAKTQSAHIALERIVTSLAYLRRRAEPGLRRLANMWACLALMPLMKTTVRGVIRREGPLAEMIRSPWRLLGDLSCEDWKQVYRDRNLLREARRFRGMSKGLSDLDALLDRVTNPALN